MLNLNLVAISFGRKQTHFSKKKSPWMGTNLKEVQVQRLVSGCQLLGVDLAVYLNH